ncbi:hypothetical protein LCGC14_2514020, partial [marine sediment metagenome]
VCSNDEYNKMFASKGWILSDNLKDADLIQFTGGFDVSPSLYGQKIHSQTFCNTDRDRREVLIYNKAIQNKIPLAGICRGGQFLSVLNGGFMWQHVNKHAIFGTHKAVDSQTGKSFGVTSTHHQMMEPGKKGLVVLSAKESTFKEKMVKNHVLKIVEYKTSDTEAVFYEDTKTFCFQPHPEFKGYDELKNKYFEYLEQYLF